VKTISAVRAAGETHPGLRREVNEDRFHVDAARGLFIVVDGMGGHAAGGKAADLAMKMLRARLERETGPISDRVREAITVANNEIRRVASLRPEWHGMACVLTVVVVDDGRAVVGHVGDTRLYKLRNGRIEKTTRDHSPVGEREDAHEISEFEAMRHPRRNEVYRDVGSEPHDALDPGFIDLQDIPFEPDAALLLCSDGLTDLVDSTSIAEVVTHFAGRPHAVVAELIQAANDAGGKDNVTVVYVEGEQFAANRRTSALWSVENERVSRAATGAPTPSRSEAPGASGGTVRQRRRGVLRFALVGLLALVLGSAIFRNRVPDYATLREGVRGLFTRPITILSGPNTGRAIVVTPSGSIAAALASASPGESIIVEPGEYRERLVLRDGIRIVSRVPRGATIRLPGTASEGDPAVVANGVSGAELVGFRIVGDAATPLGTGIFATNADVSIVDVEITGAASAAVDLNDSARLTLLGSHIHDNPGAALAIRDGASPRVSQNVFSRNGLSERVGAALIVEPDTRPTFFGNVFRGIAADAFRSLGDAAAAEAARDNWFVDGHEPPSRSSSTPRGRKGR
jgi:serine/threonine protein phosphatase PrpC